MSNLIDGKNLYIQRRRIQYDDLRMESHDDGLKLWMTSYTADESAFILLDPDDAQAMHDFVGAWLEGRKADGDHA